MEDVVSMVDQLNKHLLSNLPEYASEHSAGPAAAADARCKAGKGAKRGAKRKTDRAADPAEFSVRAKAGSALH